MLECFSADKRIELVATSLLHDFSAVARPGGAEPASFKQRRLPAGVLRFRPHHTSWQTGQSSKAETRSLQLDVELDFDLGVAAVSHGGTEVQFKDLALDVR